jgi:lysophospholipase L1-like esterase
MRSRSRETLANLALAAAATLLCALTAELVLRLIAVGGPSTGQRVAETIERYPPAYHGDCAHPEDQAVLGDIIRPAAVPDLVYELKPDLETCFYLARIRINAAGVRADREHARPKPAGLYRILLLGDSQTFGQGVAFEETFGERIAAELAADAGVPVEAVNLGVDGYNTVQEAAALASKGLSYEPDCAVLLFIGNDLGLPAFLLRTPTLTSGPSLLLDGLSGLRRQLRRERLDAFEPLTPPDPEDVPEQYRHMVGLEAHQRALLSIAEATRAAGIPVVHFTNYSRHSRGRWHGLVRWQREELGFVVPSFRLPDGEEVRLSSENPHLNPEGHRRLAELMLAAFREANVCLPPLQDATALSESGGGRPGALR